jgi:hypothetical protein
MKYQQIPLARLSKAGTRFIADGEWHSFTGDPLLMYRVVKKTVQRVRLEENENADLLKLFDSFPPFPSKVLREGFREEICFRVADDEYCIADMYVRAFVGWNMLAHVAEAKRVTASIIGGNTLSYSVRFSEWRQDVIVRALVLAKAFAMLAAQLAEDARLGIPHTEKEIAGLLHSAGSILLEEVYGSEKAAEVKPTSVQTRLFSD